MQSTGTIAGGGSRAGASGRVPLRGLRDQLIWHLGLDIVSGRYACESFLPLETEIPDRFNVSRTVVREAANALAAKGLIEARARIGTRVLPRSRWNLFDPDVLAWHLATGPDPDFLRSLSEIRLGVELQAVELAALRRSQSQADGLMRCVDDMSAAQSDEEFARADLAFHALVAEASGNPFMVSIVALVEAALDVAFTMSSPRGDVQALATTIDVHRQIAAMVGQGEQSKARDAMRTAIDNGYRRAMGRMLLPEESTQKR